MISEKLDWYTMKTLKKSFRNKSMKSWRPSCKTPGAFWWHRDDIFLHHFILSDFRSTILEYSRHVSRFGERRGPVKFESRVSWVFHCLWPSISHQDLARWSASCEHWAARLRCNLAGEMGRNYADLSLFQLLAGFMEQQEPLKKECPWRSVERSWADHNQLMAD